MFVYESFFLCFCDLCFVVLWRCVGKMKNPHSDSTWSSFENIAQRFDRTQQQEQDDSTNTIDAHLPNE